MNIPKTVERLYDRAEQARSWDEFWIVAREHPLVSDLINLGLSREAEALVKSIYDEEKSKGNWFSLYILGGIVEVNKKTLDILNMFYLAYHDFKGRLENNKNSYEFIEAALKSYVETASNYGFYYEEDGGFGNSLYGERGFDCDKHSLLFSVFFNLYAKSYDIKWKANPIGFSVRESNIIRGHAMVYVSFSGKKYAVDVSNAVANNVGYYKKDKKKEGKLVRFKYSEVNTYVFSSSPFKDEMYFVAESIAWYLSKWGKNENKYHNLSSQIRNDFSKLNGLSDTVFRYRSSSGGKTTRLYAFFFGDKFLEGEKEGIIS